MTKKAKKSSQPITALAALYVLIATLIVIATSGFFIWPFILFVLISVHACYVLHEVYKKDINSFLAWTTIMQAFFATVALFPSIIALVADHTGFLCDDKLCSEDAFFPLGVRVFIFVPMLLIAIISYYKTRD